MKLIKRIQSKPSSVKARYAFLTALFCTLVIAFVWSTTLPARFSQIDGQKSVPEEKQKTPDSFTDIFNEAKMQVGNVVNWDEAEKREVETTNLDSLSELGSQPTTSQEEVTEPEEIESTTIEQPIEPVEEESTTVEEATETETERTILIEVRKQEPVEASSEGTPNTESDTNTETP